ncbi:TetR/AcrR family transcriptional regulator C-terminal domain-containing protein [Paenibacillus polymyxa]|uniref:TetR/AcrR family transcriptional regulator n=1 Tax=Paenibacillus polymyxa TaxID=1406 RepID=UPI0025B6F019|nr:TetR/AcrR family transcriptional regulator [Paenibacillus polymyxa]MDN4078752.1 TetR/AcrR family transcriptional regulator C-terminal domain-containing protein [Paenibacillus polymyxa]MDN4104172.1 TetR/AcrR family transcriptional regulator C-terminal domain-containing protein [Paenibacillus polymyxa]MDN4114846.1 TetR/AcrR family transcriptional regulator C-terminal domain-containing protein [Paenibacillus polymyxa]
MSIYAEKNRKTKQLIQTSFIQILQNKSFELITVGDITKIAQINRGTFYLHYKDKFDLLEQIEQQLFEDLGNHIDELQSRYSSTHTFEKGQEQLAATLFSSIKMHSPILKIFLSDHGRMGFHLRFRNAFSEKVRFNLEKNESFNANLKVPMEYFLSFITSAFLGLIEQWVQNGLDKTPQEMTVLYIDIISFIQKK